MNVRFVSCIMALILMTSFTINTELKELTDSPNHTAPNYNHIGWDITFNSTSHNDGMVSNTMEIPFQNRTDFVLNVELKPCLLYTSPSPRDAHESRMPSSA